MEKAEFVKDFGEFFAEVKKEGIETTVREVATLYAIYRKDLRADRLNNYKTKFNNYNQSNADGQKPTEKQKQYLKDLADERGFRLTENVLDRMTREEASKAITTMLGGD